MMEQRALADARACGHGEHGDAAQAGVHGLLHDRVQQRGAHDVRLPAAWGGAHQCAAALEKALIMTTPATINATPVTACQSSDCLNTVTPITRVSTMPTPPQIA